GDGLSSPHYIVHNPNNIHPRHSVLPRLPRRVVSAPPHRQLSTPRGRRSTYPHKGPVLVPQYPPSGPIPKAGAVESSRPSTNDVKWTDSSDSVRSSFSPNH